MSNLKILSNTKGGVGKSTIGNHLFPVVFQDKDNKVVIIEVDSSNQSKLENTNLDITNNSDISIVINNIDFSLMTDQNTIYIIDIGANEDAKNFLKELSKEDIEADFYIPCNDDYEQFYNIQDTLKRIKKCKCSSINLILNRCISLDQKIIKDQFLNLFGSERYGVEERFSEIAEDFTNIFFVPNSPLLGVIKGKYKQFLIDNLKVQKEFLTNYAETKKELALKKEKILFDKLRDDKKFADEIINLEEDVKAIFLQNNK
jgi:anion-transporting  ArsA/GET3 family ATPase